MAKHCPLEAGSRSAAGPKNNANFLDTAIAFLLYTAHTLHTQRLRMQKKTPVHPVVSEYFRELGRMSGKKSAAKLTKKELSERGKRLARARWGEPKDKAQTKPEAVA